MKTLRGLWPYALLLIVVLGVQYRQGRDIAVGPAPLFSGMTVAGQAFDLAQLRGQPAIVYFWATWCGVCKTMQHNIDALSGDAPLISVALQSGNAQEVGRFLQERGINMPVLLDENGDLGARYGIRGVPAVFVLGPEGNIRYTAMGYSSELGLRFRLWLAGR